MKTRLILFAAVILFAVAASAQKPVSGVFLYKASISLPDTQIVIKAWNVHLCTNDTIVRIETETDLGQQVYIRHMELNKAYLLLTVDGTNYAVQTDLEKNNDSTSVETQYTVKKKRGSKKIAGFNCRKYYVQDKGQATGYTCYFAKKLSNKYLQVYPEIKGLALDYYIPSYEGLIHYELVSFTPGTVNRDLFGVPSDFKRVTFDELIHLFSGD